MAVSKDNRRIVFKTTKEIDDVLNKIIDEMAQKGQIITKSGLVEFLVIVGLDYTKELHQKVVEKQEQMKEGE